MTKHTNISDNQIIEELRGGKSVNWIHTNLKVSTDRIKKLKNENESGKDTGFFKSPENDCNSKVAYDLCDGFCKECSSQQYPNYDFEQENLKKLNQWISEEKQIIDNHQHKYIWDSMSLIYSCEICGEQMEGFQFVDINHKIEQFQAIAIMLGLKYKRYSKLELCQHLIDYFQVVINNGK